VKGWGKSRCRRQGRPSSASALQSGNGRQAAADSGARAKRRLVSEAAKELSGLDLIVNNGGIESKVALTEMPLAGMSLYPKFV
jgi:NAD(P)-dependent dehydrogenase (short-subunit alcohol dehydrogenase family)